MTKQTHHKPTNSYQDTNPQSPDNPTHYHADTVLFYHALIICCWIGIGFVFLGFAVSGYSQTANLLFNFVFYLAICPCKNGYGFIWAVMFCLKCFLLSMLGLKRSKKSSVLFVFLIGVLEMLILSVQQESLGYLKKLPHHRYHRLPSHFL